MNILLIYMVKVAVYLAAFYLVYSLLLSRDTTYARNRGFLLLSTVLSLLLPLVSFQIFKPLEMRFFGKFLSEVFVTANRNGTSATGLISGPMQIIGTIYLIGAGISLITFLFNVANLGYLIIHQKSYGSRIIRFHSFNTAGFSAMGYIFINTRLCPEEAGSIIKHEQNHLRQNHFLDIVFIELVKAFQWFNPIIYMINRALRAIHEFQADQECLSSGVPVINYQSLLLSQIFKSKGINLTNSFSNPSLIRKRMLMMTKKRTAAIANMKLLLVIPVTSLVFLTISTSSDATVTKQAREINIVIAPPPPPPPPPVSENNNVKEETTGETEKPYVVVEEMPAFPGGDAALLKYLADNTNYPESAKKQGLQGRVIVKFCVTSKGGISQADILKGVSPELDAEALRVVKTIPTFRPGMQGGVAVPVWYMVPISFTLK